MPTLLDTVALSELRKKSKAAPSVIAWQASEGGSPAYVSVITMNEIRYGAKKVAFRDPGFAARLADWYQEILVAKSLYISFCPSVLKSPSWPQITAPRTECH